MEEDEKAEFTVAKINIYIYTSGHALVKYENDFHRLNIRASLIYITLTIVSEK